jgi:hypothetical protein
LPFGPFKDKKGEALRKAWLEFPSAAESDDWSNSWMRMLVTGKIDEIEIVKPEDWGVDLRNLGWTVAEHNKERIRGLRKPLPWLHGLLKTGLFPNAKDVSVDCIFFDCHDRKHQGHSAVQVAQEAAEHLIRRARAALEAHDPLIAAILALDAVRLLGGYSATLFLDGVDVLYMAEVALELELGSASAGDPSGDTAARVGEYRELLRYLGIKNLLSGSVQASSRERLWTSLRQAYLDSGSFEGADQALLEVHSARTERLTMRLRETLKRSVGWWLIQKPLGAIPQAAKYATVPLLIVLAGLILLSNPETLAWIRVHAWWALLVPLVTFIGLGWSLACYPGGAGWVAAAIRVRAWLCVSILSILLLSTGNLILIGEVSEGTQQTPRTPTVNAAQASADTRWSSALVHLADGAFWTAGDVLGAATLPDTLQLLGRKTIFQRRDHRNAAESLLWLENLFTGWLLFAFGLSAIYRRAMRG